MARPPKTTSKNPTALKKAREFMAAELAVQEEKEKALAKAFATIERRRQVDQELGKALYTLTQLKVPQKSLVDSFNLTPREIRNLIKPMEKAHQSDGNTDLAQKED